jgi:hypothetical protein
MARIVNDEQGTARLMTGRSYPGRRAPESGCQLDVVLDGMLEAAIRPIPAPGCPMITAVNLTPPPDPPRPDDEDPAVHAGHVNVLADELARLFGLVPLAVRQQAAQAALDVVNHHLHQQQHTAATADDR